MKKFFNAILALSMSVFVMTAVVSCGGDSSDDDTVTVDTTELTTALSEATALVESATTADYPQSAIDAFQTVIDNIKTALNSGNLTQTQVDNMLVQLQKAQETFEAAAYSAIPEDALLLAYDFDTEGNQTSTGSLAWVATLATGPTEIYGTDTHEPTFVDGVSGKAVSLEKGAHLEISDYTLSSLMGSNFSISVWVNPTVTCAGNYVFSANYWNNFKLNIQTENKPFFTVATEEGIIDADNEVAQCITNNQWNHIVVTLSYDTHELIFYVNGELTKTWDKDGKPQLASNTWAEEYSSTIGKKLPLMIGASTTYEEANTVWDWEWSRTPESWSAENGFNGAIDNLKIYNIALSQSQVSKIYSDKN